MRVIGGSARGRRLSGPARPPHGERSTIRPTSDLIRGVIFDMLDAMGASYDRVLDLYAGTGALGIEALSRGDGEADFVDDDGEAVALIKRNLTVTGFADRARVYRLPVELARVRLSGPPYSLVLVDPPYYDVDAFEAIRAIASTQLVDAATVIVVEHRRKVEPLESIGRLALYRSRRHGDTVVSIYAQEDNS